VLQGNSGLGKPLVRVQASRQGIRLCPDKSRGGRAGQHLLARCVPNVYGKKNQHTPRCRCAGKEPEKSKRVMQALMQMDKLDIHGLQQAYEQS